MCAFLLLICLLSGPFFRVPFREPGSKERERFFPLLQYEPVTGMPSFNSYFCRHAGASKSMDNFTTFFSKQQNGRLTPKPKRPHLLAIIK